MQIKTLAIPGERQAITNPTVTGYPGLVLKDSIAVAGMMRSDTIIQEVTLKDNALVELVFEDGTQWLGPSDMLEELYPNGAKRSPKGDDVFELDNSLGHPDATRGLGKVFLKLVNVFAGKTEMGKGLIKQLAGTVERKILGMPVGLKSVRDNLTFVPLEALDTKAPILLLLHGTGSSAQSSFDGLPDTPLWDYWQETYGKNIVAFQHETLTKSPLENAVDLLKSNQFPKGATLHLISHSRGGLLGEVLCRFGQQDFGQINGFTDEECELFNKAGQKNDYKSILELRRLANDKQYKVEKFVRVACPAAGTTILTKRLDYFVNILLNLVGFATGAGATPAYMALKELLVAVVDQKNDPDVLPGLEAMKPDSLFIRILNNQSGKGVPIAAPVSVISGNCKLGLNGRSLFVIASKLFYWEDNDLIVNTPSMYCGSKKINGLQYFFDEGTEVDHFHYFKNKKTNGAILLALKAKGATAIDGFTPFTDASLGESERNAALGLEGGQFFIDNPSGNKPIVVLLPGIMGSSIKQNGDLIWINYLRFFGGGLSRIGIEKSKTETPAVISTSYKDLARYLADEYDVVTFPYDWRKPLTDAAALFNEKIKQLLLLKQPIKIIGHSMGGVLVRDFILEHNSTWEELNKSKDFRLLFLGSPLGGSHRILSVLFGQDSLIKKLEQVDIAHDMKALLKIFRKFPGILGLLPFTKDNEDGKTVADFAKKALWDELANHIGDKDWPVPERAELEDFKTYRDNVLKKQHSIDFSNAIYIAGQDRFTPCDYRKDKTQRGNELTILCTAEGDQSVTWDSGIPAKIAENNNVYYVKVTHGSLANEPTMFSGIKELLAKGQTNLFNRKRPTVRSSEKLFKLPEVYDFDLSPRGLENTLLGIGGKRDKVVAELPVKVKVSHGDLKYADYPLLAGHFKDDSILYAEKAIDKQLQGQLSERHSVGEYPGDIGTSEILFTQQKEGFSGAIITGLGEPGTLNSFGLTQTIKKAVVRYLLILNGKGDSSSYLQANKPLGISSLIIGCGYGGLNIENSISAILEGILLANTKIKNLYQENAKLIEHIQFVELYEDRLLACYYTVLHLCNQEGGLLNITNELNGVQELRGGRKRINLLQEEEWWNRIEVRTKDKDTKGKAKAMSFILGGNKAGQNQRNTYTNTGMVEKLAKAISTDNRWDMAKARALYELLMPHDFKDEVKKFGNIVWLLDEFTAGFPWELLHDKTTGARPLCIDSGMIRQLILEEGKGRTKIDMVRSKTALVVGDPNLKGFAGQLPGAREEAKMVAKLLEDYLYETKSLLFSSPEEIIPALFSNDYKIIHLAGHGEFSEDPDKESGMIIGDNVFLTTAEIAQVSGTSELVFVNCCFLGQTDGQAEARYQQRYKLAANIGTQLIRNGVKAVVVAGWAIDDTAALDFARIFYSTMFKGYTFGDAVRIAREDVYKKHGDTNTWGAYQCYGDPFYRLDRGDKYANAKRRFVLPEQAEIELFNLLSDLKTAGPADDRQWHEEQLKEIIAEVEACGLRNQSITEKEAFIYIMLNKPDEAVAKFEYLQTFKDATYSFAAIEQCYSLRVKKLYQRADSFEIKSKKLKELEEEFEGVVKGLSALVHIRPTAERYNLLGGTYKKKISLYPNNPEKIKEQLQLAAENYYLAYQHSADTDAVYPFANWVALQCLRVNANAYQWQESLKKTAKQSTSKPRQPVEPRNPTEIRPRLEALKESIKLVKKSGNYFDAIAQANIGFCEWLLLFTENTAADKNSDAVVEEYKIVWQKGATEADIQTELNHLGALLKGAKVGQNDEMAQGLESLINALKR